MKLHQNKEMYVANDDGSSKAGGDCDDDDDDDGENGGVSKRESKNVET